MYLLRDHIDRCARTREFFLFGEEAGYLEVEDEARVSAELEGTEEETGHCPR